MTFGGRPEVAPFVRISDGSSGIGSSVPLFTDGKQYTQRIALNSSNMPEYIGEAEPGTAESSAGWRIKKLSYTNNQVTKVTWADGTATFTKVWDNRATFSYN